jgi:hypothetical protein
MPGLLILALVILGLGDALAQDSRGTITGRVADAHDAGIPQAKVTLSNVETGVDTVLETNDRGAYVAPLLIPGSYRISAERKGFRRFSRTGITLSVNDNMQIDVRLEVGDVTQTVDVIDSPPLLEASDASMGIMVTNKELTEQPIAREIRTCCKLLIHRTAILTELHHVPSGRSRIFILALNPGSIEAKLKECPTC